MGAPTGPECSATTLTQIPSPLQHQIHNLLPNLLGKEKLSEPSNVNLADRGLYKSTLIIHASTAQDTVSS